MQQITHAQRLLGEVNVRDLDELAAQDRDRAVVDDRVRAAGERLHQVREAAAREHLRLGVLVPRGPAAHRERGGELRVLVHLLVLLRGRVVVAVARARAAEDAHERADVRVHGEARERVLGAHAQDLRELLEREQARRRVRAHADTAEERLEARGHAEHVAPELPELGAEERGHRRRVVHRAAAAAQTRVIVVVVVIIVFWVAVAVALAGAIAIGLAIAGVAVFAVVHGVVLVLGRDGLFSHGALWVGLGSGECGVLGVGGGRGIIVVDVRVDAVVGVLGVLGLDHLDVGAAAVGAARRRHGLLGLGGALALGG
jgi:hypothetical protein